MAKSERGHTELIDLPIVDIPEALQGDEDLLVEVRVSTAQGLTTVQQYRLGKVKAGAKELLEKNGALYSIGLILRKARKEIDGELHRPVLHVVDPALPSKSFLMQQKYYLNG